LPLPRSGGGASIGRQAGAQRRGPTRTRDEPHRREAASQTAPSHLAPLGTLPHYVREGTSALVWGLAARQRWDVSTEVRILSAAAIRPIGAIAFAAILLASCTSTDTTTTIAPPGRVLSVPSGGVPTIDGVMEGGEWDGAASTAMTDGSQLHWMYADEALYVALAGGDLGAVNLAIESGDEVWILHSSAALGSALYTREQSSWSLTHDFSWCCRSTTDDTGRRALLDEEGWQANIGFAGDIGVVEYEVVLPWVGGLAAVSYQTESGDPAYWPTDLSGEAEADLIGPWPEAAEFHRDEWYRLGTSTG